MAPRNVVSGMLYADGIVRAINEATMFADTKRAFTCLDCHALNAFWALAVSFGMASCHSQWCYPERCYRYVTNRGRFTMIRNSGSRIPRILHTVRAC